MGLLIYARGEGGGICNSLAWGNSTDIQLKGYPAESYISKRSIGVGGWGSDSRSRRAVHSLIGNIMEQGELFKDNIVLADHPDLDMDAEFADPVNHDYRLQSTSRFIGVAEGGRDKGPFPYEENIYYLCPEGDDSADGLSVSKAWAGLDTALERIGPGDTLYLNPGVYSSNGGVLALPERADKAVTLSGRGNGMVRIEGPLTIRGGSGLKVRRIDFAHGLVLDGADAPTVVNCRFMGGDMGLLLSNTQSPRIKHNVFKGFVTAGLALEATEGAYLQGNFFDNRENPAFKLDSPDNILYSNYNGFASEDEILKIGRTSHAMDELPWRQETHSTIAAGVFDEPGGDVSLLEVSGPYGRPLGVYNPSTDYAGIQDIQLSGPYVHSTTATTANIEWWTSERCEFSIAWGEKGTDPHEPETIDADLAGSFSLSGLEPGTEYNFTLSINDNDRGINLRDSDADAVLNGNSISISFTTATDDPEPKIYYVAPDGNDDNSGLSRQEAWRTINHAANRARSGDTVKIAGGTYHEAVRVRTTGCEGRPITFRPVPGEKVVFAGRQRNLSHFFYVTDKHHIHIDGFYLTDVGRGGVTPWPASRNGAINLYRSHNIRITRCYLDRRGEGPYSPGLLQAHHCSDILVQNCVVYGSMGGGIGLAGSPNVRIENNVFFRNFITHISEVINEPDQPVYVRNNIFTDVLPGKVTAPMITVGRVHSLIEDNNCFYIRLPVEERNIFKFYCQEAYERAAESYRVAYDPGSSYVLERYSRFTLPEYRERFNPDTTSFAADPYLEGTMGMERVDEDGKPVYLIPQMRSKINQGELEHDFNILFANNPEIIERGIGLQPEAFEDFHFSVRD